MSMSKFFTLFVVVFALLMVVGCMLDEENSGNPGGGGGGGNTPSITIRNNTGYDISAMWIKPSTSTDWGALFWEYSSLSAGQSRTHTLTQPLSANNVYDIRLRQSWSNGFIFAKYKVTVSNSMVITFTSNDLNDESDLPYITIQNRSGVEFNSYYIKPSSSFDWGESFGYISNNTDQSVTIPIPPSSYTVFDIQARSSSPTNTYTKENVTISDGMIMMYTSADTDMPLYDSRVVVIENGTGYDISAMWVKPSASTDWGPLFWEYSSLSAGQSRTHTLPLPLSTNDVYDFRLRQSWSNGFTFARYKVTVLDGMVIRFTASDLNDESDLPHITIQNRSGVEFNSYYIKPSSSSDWGESFGYISNNTDQSVTIPIPPSSYTVFDIQARSSSPTNTYTKENVTISDGMIMMYTSADTDMPLYDSRVIVVENNTGYDISAMWVKPSASTDWGPLFWEYSSLSAGQSRTHTLPLPLSTNDVYDFRLRQSWSNGFTFARYNLTVSDGMIITFSNANLE